MTSFIVADAGATKISWTLVTSDGRRAETRTPGLNALLASRADALANFSEAASALGDAADVDRVLYFGTGCSTPEVCREMAGYLAEVWPGAEITVGGDMLLAARSLLGNRRGVACILGTGSNAVLYDGTQISKSGAGLGFILGDNGAGTEIGKRLLSDCFKGVMPDDLRSKFISDHNLTLETVLDKVYRQPYPNRYLASFATFAGANRDNEYIRNLVDDEFRKFLTRDVIPLMDNSDTEVSFTGSVAKGFEHELRKSAFDMGIVNIGAIVSDPMPGIIKYYESLF
ncbi:MAG: ATPase [Muribaculaceae bacterium]|nr:ATPase [Muribaculaceae bacterium]